MSPIPTRRSIVRPCPLGTQSAADMDGSPERPTHRLVQQHRMVPMGFSVLAAVGPSGLITGFCFGAASTAEQPLAETFFALRAAPNRRLTSVGSAFSGTYVAYSKASKALKTIVAGWSATERR